MELSHTLVLATQLYSVANKEPVWAIESKSKIVQDYDHRQDYSVFVNEAEAISSHMSRDGLFAP
jgi:D-alanine-D-alanine ligase-like ATP-grasp enzyme